VTEAVCPLSLCSRFRGNVRCQAYFPKMSFGGNCEPNRLVTVRSSSPEHCDTADRQTLSATNLIMKIGLENEVLTPAEALKVRVQF
jgi:hypothetical protein